MEMFSILQIDIQSLLQNLVTASCTVFNSVEVLGFVSTHLSEKDLKLKKYIIQMFQIYLYTNLED